MTYFSSPQPEPRRLSDDADIFENSPVGMHFAAEDGTILRANRAELELLGYSPAEYVGHNLSEFLVDKAVASGLQKRLRAHKTVRNVETQMRHRDGSTRYVLISANALHVLGKFVHTRCVIRDVSELRQNEFALAQFKKMVDSAHDAIVGKDLNGIVTYWNPAAERLYGWTAAEAVGMSIALIIPPDRPDELPEIMARIENGESIEHYETVRVHKDGHRLEVSVSVSPIFDGNGRAVGASSIARDVTERKAVERQLRHGALHDALTGLPNRVFFNERVAQALDRQRRDPGYRVAVLFLDFDDFKGVNDSLGHPAGDSLLTQIAARLQTCVRPGDVVARLAGDEFTILLEDVVTQADIDHATHRLQVCLAKPYTIAGTELIVTASVGVARGDATYARAEDLVRDADIAMYHAKEQGHARAAIFNIAMRRWAHAKFGMTNDLRRAIDRNEFRLVFQPIVSLEDGKIASFEALLRWNHPTRGEILPAEFIPVAEQTGLIVPIGAWAMTEACRTASRWRWGRPGRGPVRISVNLSGKQLGRAHIVDDVREVLRTTSLDPTALHLEVTETVLIENADASIKRLSALRELNVELHVDDFGTGYSSLSYLPRFPLQAVKVDRSFVNRMGARRTDLEIVRAIVDLSTKLGLGVIAEGIETAAQRKRLLAFGCKLGQGFLFSPPVSASAVTELLKAS